jgi:hypothetical protein
VRQLIRTIDWFLTLSSEDDRLVRKAIEADEQEKKMPYITLFRPGLDADGVIIQPAYRKVVATASLS